MLERSNKCLIFCCFIAAFLTACTLFDGSTAGPTADPPWLVEARQAERDAIAAVESRVAELNRCVLQYARTHALADATPNDIITAARGGCLPQVDAARNAVQIQVGASSRVKQYGGQPLSGMEYQQIFTAILADVDAIALDLIVKLRTPTT